MSGRRPWDIFRGGAAVEVLDAPGCAEIAGRVMSCRPSWTERRPMRDQVHLFHTLGAASYLDSGAAYQRRAAALNPVLRERFGDLLERVAATVAARLDAPVRLSEDLALPGFHIYRGDERAPPGLMYGGTIHLDTPHRGHRFPFEVEATLSLTLPIRLPACGGGMYYWEDAPDWLLGEASDPARLSHEAYNWFDANKRQVTYRVGWMVLHDGSTAHQVANIGRTRADEYRISLQAHGVFGDGGWVLFF